MPNYRDAATGQYTTAEDAAARPAETVAETVEAHHETPDLAELRRLLDVNRERYFHALPWHAWDRGIGYELHVGATCRDEMEPRGYCEEVNNGFRETFGAPEAELIVAAVNALPTLLDRLAHMTEARDNARAEVKRLTTLVEAIEADDDKLSIMSGWLVYDVGEHTCGGYGPESGYVHEPGCGFEPVLRLDKLQGWPEVERLTALAEAARKYAAARQANIDHGPLLSARKAAHDALLAAMARLDEPQP